MMVRGRVEATVLKGGFVVTPESKGSEMRFLRRADHSMKSEKETRN